MVGLRFMPRHVQRCRCQRHVEAHILKYRQALVIPWVDDMPMVALLRVELLDIVMALPLMPTFLGGAFNRWMQSCSVENMTHDEKMARSVTEIGGAIYLPEHKKQ